MRSASAPSDGVKAARPADAGPAPEALSVEKAASAAGVSRTFLYERISSGELPSVKLGRRRLVRVEALRRWLASLEAEPA
jgi:excisionase family DNA binding protein